MRIRKVGTEPTWMGLLSKTGNAGLIRHSYAVIVFQDQKIRYEILSNNFFTMAGAWGTSESTLQSKPQTMIPIFLRSPHYSISFPLTPDLPLNLTNNGLETPPS